MVAVLDIDVLYYPCPRNGPNFRPKVVEMGGKQQSPYMVRLIPLNQKKIKLSMAFQSYSN